MPLPASDNRSTVDHLTNRAISHELHQTAQPLTVLQGLLELALLNCHTAEEYREAVQRAMEQSRRVSGGFDLVRKLFHFRQPRVSPSRFSMSGVVNTAVDRVRNSYAHAGVACNFIQPSAVHDGLGDLVIAAQDSFSAALALILSHLPRWAGAGGSVEIEISVDLHNVHLRIGARKQQLTGDNQKTAESSLLTAAIHLAKSVVASAGGSVTQVDAGVSLLIALPKAQPNLTTFEDQGIECVHV